MPNCNGHVIVQWLPQRQRWELVVDGPEDVFPSRQGALGWIRHLPRLDADGQPIRYAVIGVVDEDILEMLHGPSEPLVWPVRQVNPDAIEHLRTYQWRDPFAGDLSIEADSIRDALESAYEDVPAEERPAVVFVHGQPVRVPGGQAWPADIPPSARAALLRQAEAALQEEELPN
ncbi:MAG: hypothetical protein KatS3mg051_2302 [Anaerolineae bacterium]|nr:MAG: hypothetical protein KatS3mg051_2302 [Anaerolineae bacterium]